MSQFFRSDIENSSFLFKPFAEGYVFRAPNPRVFGRANHYLVSESQKAEISTVMGGLTLRRPYLVLTTWFIALLLGLIVFINFATDVDTGIAGLVILTGVMIASVVLPPAYALYWYANRQLKALQAILATASRTDQQITLADIRAGINKAQSFKQAALAAGLSGMMCLGFAVALVLFRNHKLPIYTDPLAIQFLVSVIIFGVMSATNIRNVWTKIETTAAPQPGLQALPKPNLRARLMASALTLAVLLAATGVVGISQEFSNLNQGLRYAENGETDKAIFSLSKALEADPRNTAAYRHRAASFMTKGDHVRAVADYTSIIEAEPKDAGAYHLRGKAQLARTHGDSAIADFTKAIELDPKRAIAYYDRGSAFAKKPDYDRAIADFTKAIELEPKDSYAYSNRARNFYAKNDTDRAIADITKAIEINPKPAHFYAQRAAMYAKKSDHDRAIADFTHAIVRNPTDRNSYVGRAMSYTAKSEPERALADYKSVVALPTATEDDQRLQQTTRRLIELLTPPRLAPAQK